MSFYAVGVDSGTQSTKVLIVDADTGRVAGRGRAPHAFVPGLPPGSSEQEPETWFRALEAALRDALSEAAVDPRTIVALGVSGQQHGFVPLDGDGRVIRPAKLWNDTSTVRENDDLVRSLGGPAACLEKLGLVPAVGFTASKILWLKTHEPRRFARLSTVLLPHDYLNYRLTGIARMEYGDASGTGLMDVRTRRWNGEAAAAVDPSLMRALPGLRHPGEPLGEAAKAFADAFGFGSVLVSAGGGDNMMGAIGTGNVVPGVVTASLGTSGTVFAYFDRPFSDPEGEIAAFCDSTGGWLPLLCTMNVTNATELWKGILAIGNEERDTLAARAPAGSGGLVFLPFIDGERVPVLPGASGVFFGLNRETFRSPHLTRAVMEGTILNLGYGFGRMRGLGLSPSEIRVTGGGAGSPLWLRLVAGIFGTPVRTLAEPEAAALGAAIQAIWSWKNANGETTPISSLTDRMVRVGPAMEPDTPLRDVYGPLQERFNLLWRTLAPVFRAG